MAGEQKGWWDMEQMDMVGSGIRQQVKGNLEPPCLVLVSVMHPVTLSPSPQGAAVGVSPSDGLSLSLSLLVSVYVLPC